MQKKISPLKYTLDLPLSIKKAEEWSYVLQAMRIPHEAHQTDEGWILTIPEKFQKEAAKQANLYQIENSREESESQLQPLPERKTLGYFPFLVSFLFYLFHLFVNNSMDYQVWMKNGIASSDLILQGQWWRTITSTTLHADLGHLFSNILFGGIILASLRSHLGKGWTWFSVLLTGLTGNYLNALIRSSGAHQSIGASTCVFGAIGILAGLQFFDKIKRKSLRSWAPLAGAFAFLTLFGQGEKIDFGAHLFGFLSGLIFSLPMYLIISKGINSKIIIQRFLSCFSLLFIIFCWCKAFKML